MRSSSGHHQSAATAPRKGGGGDASVSKMSMGSAGIMDTGGPSVSESNRGQFASQQASGSRGQTHTESRDPMSQKGVLRKFAWES